MLVFDASSIIHAWDNYPIRQFPGLWEWITTQIREQNLVLPTVAFEEVNNKTPDCGEWLRKNDIRQLDITNAIMQNAVYFKQLLKIKDDNYHPKGVGENDIFIIATAFHHKAELVSNESRQKTPDIPTKMKIPAVCGMKEVAVSCINFIEYLKRSGEVFR